MPALVLCDGGQSSLRAIEVAGYPGGLFMAQHDGTQLVMVHAWTKAASAPAATAVTTGNAHAGPASPNTTQTSPRPQSSSAVDTAAEAEVAASAMRAVNAGVSPAQVLQSVQGTIKESKLLRDTLLYKLETAVVPRYVQPDESDGDGNGTSGAPSSVKRGESPRKTTPQPARGAKKKDAAGPGSSINSALQSPLKTPEEQAEAQRKKLAAEQAFKAQAIVAYASGRAAHHGCDAVVLGAGNASEGKAITIGHTAREVLASLRHSHLICFVKPEGFVPRRTCTVTRFVVVVAVAPEMRTVSAEAEATHTVAELHDAPSRVVRESVPSGSGVAAAVGPGEVDGGVSAALDAGRAAVRYALRTASAMASLPSQRAPAAASANEAPADAAATTAPSSLSCKVAVLLVVEPQTDAGTVAHFQLTFETLLGSKSTAAAEGVEDASLPAATAAAAVSTATVEDATSDAVEEPWAPVTVLTLKSSKQVKEPTIENSAAQASRYVQQTRAEYVLVADSAPTALQEALLSAVKPHCIVVPHVKY